MSGKRQGVTIVVDAMGGDYAPGVNIKGALAALESSPDLHIILVGQQEVLTQELKKHHAENRERLEVINADEVISMEDHGALVVRKKKESSIHVGLRLVKEKKADAFISAGNSGAVMAGALLVLGRLHNVERPAIIIKLPTAEGYIIILDAGANVDCRPSHLVQFAEMGHVYAEVIEKLPSPRISLLSNGSEEHKGNELTRGTNEILRQRKDLNYIGYVEGYDLFRGIADVVVCDGFVGNVTLKLAEGLGDAVFKWFRKEVKRDFLGLAGVILMRRVLKKFKDKFDYQPYGAAPLLGIDGMVLISHGSSTDVAIRNGILTAKRGVEQNFTQKISDHLAKKRADSEKSPIESPSPSQGE